MPYQEKKGTWRAHKMIDGKRKTKRFATKAEAKRWEADQNQEIWEASTTDMVFLSVQAWLNSYLDYVKPRVVEKTFMEEKLTVFARFIQFFSPSAPVETVTKSLARDYLGKQAEKRSGGAANKERKNLAAAWNWGVRHLDLPEKNPFLQIDPFPCDQRKKYVPPLGDVYKVIEVARPEDRVFLLALLHTAARRGELLRLRWTDVDFENSKIRLGTRKREGGAMEFDWIPMTSTLKAALLSLRASTKSVFVFNRPEDGQPYKWRQHLMRRLCERAGVEYFGFHAIRHLTASILAKEGKDIPTIQSILRHQSPLTTARYIKKLGFTDNALEDVFVGAGSVGNPKKETPEAATSGV